MPGTSSLVRTDPQGRRVATSTAGAAD